MMFHFHSARTGASMERERESAPLLIQFLDSFLHERNIKWMLGVGMIILLGSSLRLVSMHWGDYTAFWKYGILLTYTAALFAASQVSYFRLGLHRTGTALMSLTVILIPLTFYALHWVGPSEFSLWPTIPQQVGLFSLVGLNLVLSSIAAHRIFVHFLRRPQWTFEFCYLALSVAAAILPAALSILPAAGAYGIVGGLWLLFTVGTIKVNRHLFWLNEEERRPRVFGFFPILLLGAQFFGLFTLFFSSSIPLQWWGLGCALVAVPVLLTGDTVAKVFQQRTGDLVRPLPMSVIVPLVVGLILCAVGLGLSATGIPRPYAIVPTAALVAIVMGMVARRTRYPAFAWAGIACLLIAYQFSPLFFLEAAKAVVQQGAVAVHESRMPYAFYGLTYLPILISFTIGNVLCHRYRLEVFAVPLKQAATILACVFLVAGVGHPKATFLVSATMLGVLALQILCFRERILLLPLNLALVGAFWGFSAFQMLLFNSSSPYFTQRFLMASVAFLQLVPGGWIDRWSRRMTIATPASLEKIDWCQQISLIVTFFTGMSCCLGSLVGVDPVPPLMTGLLVAGLFLVHTLVTRDYQTGIISLIYLNLFIALYWMTFAFSWRLSLLAAVSFLTLQWSVGASLAAWPNSKFAQAFSRPLTHVANTSLILLMFVVVVPLLALGQWCSLQSSMIVGITAGVLAGWCFVASWRNRSRGCLLGGFLILILLPGALLKPQLNDFAMAEWLPLIWSLAAMVQVAVLKALERTSGLVDRECSSEIRSSHVLDSWTSVLLTSVAVGMLFSVSLPARIASAVALIGLFRNPTVGGRSLPQAMLGCLAHLQLLGGVIQILAGETGSLPHVFQQFSSVLLFPVALFATLSVLMIELILCARATLRISQSGMLALANQRRLMLLIAAFMLGAPLLFSSIDRSALQVVAAMAAFGCLGISQLVRAVRDQSQFAVWGSLGIGGVGIGYAVVFDLVSISLTEGVYSLLASSLILWGIGGLSSKQNKLKILSEPFVASAYWMPLAGVVLGGVAHILNGEEVWKGVNSLGLLLAAAFYFFQGMEEDRKRNWTLSVVILNIAIAMLWDELHWYDAQLFMIPAGASILLLVELLRREIPEFLHAPLRYIGALTILTSPAFEIVQGSWWHLLSLMILSVAVLLLAMGLRTRALVYSGTAFLIVDLVAIVVRSGIDHPHLLWGAGIILGLCVIGLAAYCEHHREKLIARIRMISADLETWR